MYNLSKKINFLKMMISISMSQYIHTGLTYEKNKMDSSRAREVVHRLFPKKPISMFQGGKKRTTVVGLLI